MGRVFSFSEIAAGNVPTPGDFEDGRQDIIDTMTRVTDIEGAILIGSIIHGTATIRSDIDIVYYYHETPTVMSALHGLRQRSLERNLDISLIPIEAEMSRTKFHAITHSFNEHLKLMVAHGGLIKRDFTAEVMPWQTERDDLIAYLAHKWRYFNKRLNKLDFMAQEDAKYLETLQKSLELAPHIARKIISLWDVEPEGDSKRAVAAAYGQVAPTHMGEQISQLAELDRWYSDELNLQLQNPNQRRYQTVLERLAREAVPLAYTYLRGNIMLVEENYQPATAHQLEQFELVESPSALRTVA